MTDKNDLLVWLDLETTGFDNENQMKGVQKHKILEVGIHITDSQLNIVDEGFEVVIHYEQEELNQVMDSYVSNMHSNNGLLDKVAQSQISLKEAEQMMIAYVVSHGVIPKKSPICGNNVSFDKNFIDAHMPEFSKVLHYRKLDVSSFKELFSRQYPEVVSLVNKSMKHRGLDDIKESIAELKLYQTHIFKNNETLVEKKKNKP